MDTSPITKFPDGAHYDWGTFDNVSRWTPNEELYDIDGAFMVRPPSGAYPYSYLKHFYTLKLAWIVFRHNPNLYCKIHGISRRTMKYKKIMSIAVLRKLKGGE